MSFFKSKPRPPALPLESYDVEELTVLDNIHVGQDEAVPTFAFIIDGHIDTELLRAKLDALTTKWPLLGGRLDVDEKGNFKIFVPKSGVQPPGGRFTLTTGSKSGLVSAQVPMPTLNSTPSITREPDSARALVLGPDTPTTVPAYYASAQGSGGGWPLLNLHLTHFPDERRTALGITGPHLVTDATGFGLVLSALGSELRGEKWTPPPLSSQSGTCDLHPINFPAREDGGASSQTPGNLRAALSKILAEPEPKRVETPPGLAAMSAMDMLSMVTKIGMDFARNGGSRRWIWLPDAALEKIVKPIKQQAKEEDASVNVSTVDCLAAWLLKTGYSDGTPGTQQASFSTLQDVRPHMGGKGDLTTYPHNAVLFATVPATAASTFQDASLGTTALLIRRSIIATRTPGTSTSVSPTIRYMARMKKEKRTVTPMTKKGQDMWIVTPHGVLPPKSRLDFASVLSKSSLPGFAAEGKGAQASGAVLFQWRTQLERVKLRNIGDTLIVKDTEGTHDQLHKGALVAINLRDSKWEAFEKEIQRLV